MNVNQFMLANLPAIKQIISQLQKPFDSHAFIERFKKVFEKDYVELLSIYRQNKSHQIVHLQIGNFLSRNQEKLGIQKQGKVNSVTVFGIVNPNEQWS